MKFVSTVALLAVATALTAGCASYEKPIPDNYTGPKATIRDSGAVQSSSLVHIFELTRIDGRKLRGSGIATVSANQGRGFSQTPVILSNEVPAKALRIQIEGATMYAAPILAMTNPTCRVGGEVELNAEPGKTYVVTGKLAAETCEVWVQDAATGAEVTTKVKSKGTK
ncbi:MAG: hypothetical protein H6933_02670 [Burkholderiaceae bacterium]|nr:hypothetical protein [Burkholderiaceae bacterium]